MAGAPNFANRTMWTRDNLDVLRGLNSESIDLVYADPPFNSNKNYSAPIGSKAAGAAFKDSWTLSDVDLAWHGEIAERRPRVYAAIEAAGVVHGKGMRRYLTMMAVRLLELRRVLKPSGSLYLHCDSTANAYLRVLLDAVFGAEALRNVLRLRDRVRERRVARPAVDRYRPLSSSGHARRVAAARAVRRVRRDPPPDRRAAADGPRGPAELPLAQTHAVRPPGGPMRRLRMAFPFRNFEIDHVIPCAKGGSDHVDNLQMLCGACNRAKGTRTQAELFAKLRERGQLAA